MSGQGGLRKRQDYFVQVAQETVRDTSVSYRALGILTYILDRPEGWDVRSEQMANDGKGTPGRKHKREGREAIRTALRELAEAGYYRVERRRLRSGAFAMGTAVSEKPVEAWARQYQMFGSKPIPVVEQEDGTFLVRYPNGSLLPEDVVPHAGLFAAPGAEAEPAAPEDGFPGPGEPAPGNPEPGEPAPGNPAPLKEGVKRDLEEPPLPPASGGRDQQSPEPKPLSQPGRVLSRRTGQTKRCRHNRTTCRPCGTTPRQLAEAEAAQARQRPPWCGECDEGKRQVLDDPDKPVRCPRCHPMNVNIDVGSRGA